MIVIEDDRLLELAIFKAKEHYEKIKDIAEQNGLITVDITRNIIQTYLNGEWESVVQMIMDKYFQTEWPNLKYHIKQIKETE